MSKQDTAEMEDALSQAKLLNANGEFLNLIKPRVSRASAKSMKAVSNPVYTKD